MNRLVAVHAPAQVVGDVIVISVELWTHAVFVHLARVETEEIDWLAADFDAAIGQDLNLADDVGTRYRPRGGHAGGTGTEWRAEWQFAPRVPEHASRLTIAIGSDAMELAL